MPTENQNNRYSAGFNPISKFTPNRVLSTNESGYAEPSNVTSSDLENFHEIVESAQGIFKLDSINDL